MNPIHVKRRLQSFWWTNKIIENVFQGMHWVLNPWNIPSVETKETAILCVSCAIRITISEILTPICRTIWLLMSALSEPIACIYTPTDCRSLSICSKHSCRKADLMLWTGMVNTTILKLFFKLTSWKHNVALLPPASSMPFRWNHFQIDRLPAC